MKLIIALLEALASQLCNLRDWRLAVKILFLLNVSLYGSSTGNTLDGLNWLFTYWEDHCM